MKEEDFVPFGEALSACWALYGKETTESVLNISFDALKRYDLSDITMALTRHLNDPDAGQFYPKPADIVRNIDGSKSSRGMLAWSAVEKAIRQVGGGESVVFDDRITHAVIRDMGGWVQLCKVTEDEIPFRAREFEKRYQAYVLQPPIEYPGKLIGEFEAYNSAEGHKVESPVLIGNQERAALVYQNGSDGQINHITRLSGSVNKAMAALTDNREQRRA